MATREQVLERAGWMHDLKYGIGHCDRKYAQVCPKFQENLFAAAQQLREEERVDGDS